MFKFFASKPKAKEYPAFTNFTIKVDAEDGSWPNTVRKVLNSLEGPAAKFRMENSGKIHISGYIDPTLFLKCLQKAGKTAQIVHWEYGECSSNLFEKTESSSVNYGNTGYYLNQGCEGYYKGYPYNNNYGMRSNYPFNQLEYCSGHHIQKPKTRSKSSSSSTEQFEKLSSHPQTCCSLM